MNANAKSKHSIVSGRVIPVRIDSKVLMVEVPQGAEDKILSHPVEGHPEPYDAHEASGHVIPVVRGVVRPEAHVS